MGLRDALDITEDEMARVMEVTTGEYQLMERGDMDPGVSRLQRVARRYGVEIDALLFGEEPTVGGYFVTRRGTGPSVERNANYLYESLAAGFKARRMDPFLTVIEPLADGQRRTPNSHEGQEFDYILDGELEITIDQSSVVLHPGDSICFDATHPHCMHATGQTACRMLLIVV